MIQTQLSPQILAFLNTDRLQNLNLLGALENQKDAIIYVDHVENPQGVLVQCGYFSYIYTLDTAFLDDLLENHYRDNFFGFSGLSSFVANYIEPHLTKQWSSPCDLYYLPEGALKSHLKTRKVVNIPIEEAPTVDYFYTYRDNHTLKMIENDILTLPTSAYYVDGEMVCWCLVHDDNSLGIMYTKEGHRGKGYAVDVTIDLCEKELARGKTPFLQINTSNQMSPGLALKCGFVKYGQANATWFGGYFGTPEAFQGVATALKQPEFTILPLFEKQYGQQDVTGQPYTFKDLGEAQALEPLAEYPEATNTRHRAAVELGSVAVATLNYIVHDNYWVFVETLDFVPGDTLENKGTLEAILLAFAAYQQGLERSSLIIPRHMGMNMGMNIGMDVGIDVGMSMSMSL